MPASSDHRRVAGSPPEFLFSGVREGNFIEAVLNGRKVRMRPFTMDLYTAGEIYADGVYDGVVDALQPASDVRNIIDLGGNIGLSVGYFADRFRNAVILTAEPDPQNAELLRHNADGEIRDRRVHIFEGAFWPHDGQVTYHAADNPIKVNEGYVRTSGAATGEREIIVEALTIDSLCKRFRFALDAIDLVKVDIEGGELHLLSGDNTWLDRTRCLAVEFHGDARARSGFDAIVQKRGFTIREPNQHTVIALRSAA